MVVTVTAGLFMVKTQSMKELMLDSVVVDTATAVQRHCLPITEPSHIGIASVKYTEIELTSTSNLITILFNMLFISGWNYNFSSVAV